MTIDSSFMWDTFYLLCEVLGVKFKHPVVQWQLPPNLWNYNNLNVYRFIVIVMGLKFLTVSGYRKSWHVSSQCCRQLIESAIGGAEIALCVLISIVSEEHQKEPLPLTCVLFRTRSNFKLSMDLMSCMRWIRELWIIVQASEEQNWSSQRGEDGLLLLLLCLILITFVTLFPLGFIPRSSETLCRHHRPQHLVCVRGKAYFDILYLSFQVLCQPFTLRFCPQSRLR